MLVVSTKLMVYSMYYKINENSVLTVAAWTYMYIVYTCTCTYTFYNTTNNRFFQELSVCTGSPSAMWTPSIAKYTHASRFSMHVDQVYMYMYMYMYIQCTCTCTLSVWGGTVGEAQVTSSDDQLPSRA